MKTFNFSCCFLRVWTWSTTLGEEHRLCVLENKVLRNIFGIEIIGRWRKVRNEELYELCFSPNVIRVIKPRRKRGRRHVKWKINKRKIYSSYFSETPKEKSQFDNPDAEEWVILRWTLKQRKRYKLTGFISLKNWPVAGSCSSENETSLYINGEDFLVVTTLLLKDCFMQLVNQLVGRLMS